MADTPQKLAGDATKKAETTATAISSFPTREARSDGSNPNYVSMGGKQIKVRGGGGDYSVARDARKE